MEAEIYHGSATVLESLASSLSATFGYSPSVASKFEVAFERFKLALPSKQPTEKLKVCLEDRLDLAVRKILTYQFQRFREQLAGVRQDIDTEFVHQARVATRRMRSAVRLFREAIPQSVVTYLGEELKWLGNKFGTVRDLDVFLLNLSRFRPQIKRFPSKKKKALENWIEKHRRSPLKALQEALESSRYKSFERRFTQFLERPLPARPRAPLAARPVREVAPVLIKGKFEGAIEQGHKVLAKPKLKQFHVLRIQMKKLRYAVEFMAPAYEGALTPFIERTVEIQDCLGELQDTVFTREFVEFLLDKWKGKLVEPDLLFILGEIYQLQTEIAADRREKFGNIWERFSSEETVNLLKETFLPPAKAAQIT
jgi:CHAD domain-containing protein